LTRILAITARLPIGQSPHNGSIAGQPPIWCLDAYVTG
jgi:hypothetical protein